MNPKRKGYRDHRRASRQHFSNKWRERICDQMPKFDLIKEELDLAVSGKESEFFKLVHYNYYSTRWRSKYAGKTIIVAYDHSLRTPVTVWEEGVDYRVQKPNPVITKQTVA